MRKRWESNFLGETKVRDPVNYTHPLVALVVLMKTGSFTTRLYGKHSLFSLCSQEPSDSRGYVDDLNLLSA